MVGLRAGHGKGAGAVPAAVPAEAEHMARRAAVHEKQLWDVGRTTGGARHPTTTHDA